MNDLDSEFVKELSYLINKYSKENSSDTPDFLLALFLNDCLIAYEKTILSRKAFIAEHEKFILKPS